MNYKLIHKSKNIFIYEQKNGKYISVIQIGYKNTINYKGVQISCYQKDVNSEGFNNSVGMRKAELLRLPFMILHFQLYRLLRKRG